MSPPFRVTNLERENLECHVDLCAERYAQSETRLEKIEAKIETLHNDIHEGRQSMSKIIVGSATTVVAALISTIVTVLMKF